MSSEVPVFTVGPPPHWRSKSSIAQMNYAMLAALAPAAALGAIAYGFGPNAAVSVGPGVGILGKVIKVLLHELGISANVLSMAGAFGVLALGAGVGVLAEYAIQIAFRQPYRATDGHGALIGLIMAMLMPPTVPAWVLVVGVVLAILVGKQIFGGLGGYPMHPAMVGWLILLLSWPHHIYPVGMESMANMHWVVIFVTFMGGISLVALGHVRWEVPFGVVLGVVVSAGVFHSQYADLGPGTFYADVLHELVSGHVMLAAFFLATDSTCSPTNKGASWIYAIGVGFLIMLIRVYGIWPDAVPFAVLLMNILSPLLDKIRPAIKEVVIQHG